MNVITRTRGTITGAPAMEAAYVDLRARSDNELVDGLPDTGDPDDLTALTTALMSRHQLEDAGRLHDLHFDRIGMRRRELADPDPVVEIAQFGSWITGRFGRAEGLASIANVYIEGWARTRLLGTLRHHGAFPEPTPPLVRQAREAAVVAMACLRDCSEREIIMGDRGLCAAARHRFQVLERGVAAGEVGLEDLVGFTPRPW